MSKLTIYTDGGARGNPGPAGIGFIIYDEDGKILKKHKEFIGKATNNQAEYLSLVKALELAQTFSKEKIECFLDSELVVNQLKGQFKVKNSEIRDLIFKVRILEPKYKSVDYQVIPREKNKEADELVNKAIDEALR
ncbi:MAG: reverse transcriptase-like protein [Candidatus Aenigmarchaeota archaeon]|nr:reverse transcriptase-like protein [Candidatus Aenigmarchaeota archaeon]